MILVRTRVMVVISLAVLIFTVVAGFLSSILSAPASFAADEGFVISDSSAPTIFSSQVDVSMVDALSTMPNVTSASPEILSFSTWNGVSFVIRGRGEGFGDEFELSPDEIVFPSTRGLSYDPGTMTLVGTRLLGRFNFEIPFTIPLVGSYASKVDFVQIVGYYETGSSLDDELLVPIDVARYLTGMPHDKVSMIGVATTDPEWLSSLLSPADARFTLSDLRLSKATVGLGEILDVMVRVQNWGASSGSTEVSFVQDGSVVSLESVALNASSSTVLVQSLSTESLGPHSVEVGISEDFPVKLIVNFTVVEPYLRIAAPTRVSINDPFNVTVTKYTGEPAVGATVTFLQQIVQTNENGRVSLVSSEAGDFAFFAYLEGYLNGTASIKVVDPSEYPSYFNPDVVAFLLSPSSIVESEHVSGVVVVENNGTVPGFTGVTAYIDGSAAMTNIVYVDAMSSAMWSFEIDDLSPGNHVVQVGRYSHSVFVESWYADDPDLIELVVRYGGSTTLSSSASIPISQAAKISQGNISAALFSIGAIAAVLTILAIVSIFAKDVRERRRTFGILKTLGASRSEVTKMVFYQALGICLLGTAVGILIGVLVTMLLSDFGAFVLFGHELSFEIGSGLLLTILLGAATIGLVSVSLSVFFSMRESVVASVRELEERSQAP